MALLLFPQVLKSIKIKFVKTEEMVSFLSKNLDLLFYKIILIKISRLEYLLEIPLKVYLKGISLKKIKLILLLSKNQNKLLMYLKIIK